MSLKKSSSRKTYSNTSTTTGSSTTKPLVPEWGTRLAEGVAGRANGLLDLDSNSLNAPVHSLQNQAANTAANLSGQSWNFDGALDLTRGAARTSWLDPYMTAAAPAAEAGFASNYVNSYLSPYLREVVDSSAADLDAQAGQVRAQQALNLAGSGAFGGSGAAITQSMTEGELARARASTLSGLRSRAYDTALGAAAGDADRFSQASIANAQMLLQDRAQKVGFGFQGQQQQLAAAKQVADLASAYETNQRANVAAQAQMGETLRGIDQQQRQAPVTHAQQVAALLSGLPISLFTGEQKDSTSTETGSGKEKAKSSEFGFSAADFIKPTALKFP